jgi:hypothetical protein
LKIIDKSFLKKDFEQIKDMIRGIEVGGQSHLSELKELYVMIPKEIDRVEE